MDRMDQMKKQCEICSHLTHRGCIYPLKYGLIVMLEEICLGCLFKYSPEFQKHKAEADMVKRKYNQDNK